jgi:broad specificity phosphatase PhoE
MPLYIARHGQTQANAEHRYLGSLDAELNETGRLQAIALASQVPRTVDAIVVSPLLRARQTAEILNEHLHLPLHIIECFKERNVGVFEGLTQAEAERLYPDLWARNITRQWEVGPPQGESIAATVARVHQGLVQLIQAHPSENLLLVAHGFIAKTVRALVRRDFSDFYDWQLNNGQLLTLDNVETVLQYVVPSQDPLPAG